MKKKNMSMYAVMAAMFLTAMLVFGAGCGGGDSAAAPGDLEALDEFGVTTSEDLRNMFNISSSDLADDVDSSDSAGINNKDWLLLRLGELSTCAWKNSMGGVGSYKITYSTTNAKGDVVKATGAVLVPYTFSGHNVPMLVIQHPTEVERKKSPSASVKNKYTYNADIQMWLSWLCASMGYVVVMPDYLGMGDNYDIHPYCHENLADSIVDIVAAIAGPDFKAKNWGPYTPSTWDKKNIYLMGFSEGAYATVVGAKRMQDRDYMNRRFGAGLLIPTPTGVVAYDGPYSLSETMRDVMRTAGPEFSSPYFLPYTLSGYDSVYASTMPEFGFRRNVRNDVSKYKDYPGELLKVMDGIHTADEITDLMIDPFSPDNYIGPRTILTAAFSDDLADVNSKVCKALASNDAFRGWTPTMKLQLFHHVSDDLVPHGNMDEARKAWQTGSGNIGYESFKRYVPISKKLYDEKIWHIDAFLIGFVKAVYWVDNQAYNRLILNPGD